MPDDRVYLLTHSFVHDDECETEAFFLLGVYSTRSKAESRLKEARQLPGFRRYPDGFVIDEYELDKDEWTSGFATMTEDGEWVHDPAP